MKKALITLALLAVLAPLSRAQEVKTEVHTEKEVIRVDTLEVEYLSRYKSAFLDNWFVGINGGARMLFAEEDGQLALGRRITPGIQLTFGKEIFPLVTLRANAGLGKLRGWNSGAAGLYKYQASWYETDPVRTWLEEQGKDCSAGYEQNITYVDVSTDVMLDLTNLVRREVIESKGSLFALMGIEYFHILRAGGYYATDKVGYRFGLAGEYNLTPTFALTAEAVGIATDATFDNEIGKGKHLDSFLTANVGVKWRIGGQGFTTERLVPASTYQKMGSVINGFQEHYEQTISGTDHVEIMADESSLFAPSVVFDDDKSTYSEELQMVNLFRMAQWMEQNPEVRVVVIGNTHAASASLARKRAEIIRSTLINRYGIRSGRLLIALKDVNLEYGVAGAGQTVNFGVAK